jgi:surface polysaccharide O-acyltransferase-like enzyme
VAEPQTDVTERQAAVAERPADVAERPAAVAERPAHKNERRVDVDAIRALGVLAIVTIHVTGPFIAAGTSGSAGPTYWIAEVAGAASRVGVAAFFALAGWAILVHRPEPDDSGFLGRRLRRLVLPLVAWSAIYIVQSLAVAALLGRTAWAASLGGPAWFVRELSWTVFGPGVKYHLWFLYFLIAAIVVLWLARGIPGRGGEVAAPPRAWARYGLVAVGALLVFGLAATFRAPLTWTGFVWVIGYAALGLALLEGPHPSRRAGLVIYLVAAGLIAALGRIVGYNEWPYFNQGPLAVLATIGLFWALRDLTVSAALRDRLRSAAGLSFGIYLAHPLILDYVRLAVVRDPIGDWPGPLRLGLAWFVTLALTSALVVAWHRSPRLVRLLG